MISRLNEVIASSPDNAPGNSCSYLAMRRFKPSLLREGMGSDFFLYGLETPAKLTRGNGPRLGIVIPMTYFSGLSLYFFHSCADIFSAYLTIFVDFSMVITRRLFRRLVHGTGFRHNIISYFFHDFCRLLARDPCAKRQT